MHVTSLSYYPLSLVLQVIEVRAAAVAGPLADNGSWPGNGDGLCHCHTGASPFKAMGDPVQT